MLRSVAILSRYPRIVSNARSTVSLGRWFSTEGPIPSAEPLTTEAFRRQFQIHISGGGDADFTPVTTFEAAPFCKKLKDRLLGETYVSPTATQAQSWPIAASGRDMVSVARTGSGKTCAFLLPGLQKVLDSGEPPAPTTYRRRQNRIKPPKILVLAPTRELCVQIGTEANKYGPPCGLPVAIIYGGAGKSPQIQALQNGAQVIVGTPGRVNDLIDQGYLDIREVKYFVLDEADRMLDMGFEPQISRIVESLPADRQTLFFSATWPREVQSMASQYLTNPVLVQIGDVNELNANKAITQNFSIIKPMEKIEEMLDTVESLTVDGNRSTLPKTIIFRSTKADAEYAMTVMKEEGFTCEALHGDKSQSERDRVMERFRNGKIRCLVATDVAARGLDIKDIEVVINVDFPNSVEDYVHRIGRTGRGDRTGVSYTFLTMQDKDKLDGLRSLLLRSQQTITSDMQAYLGLDRDNRPRSTGSKSKYGVRNTYSDRRTMPSSTSGYDRSRGPRSTYPPREQYGESTSADRFKTPAKSWYPTPSRGSVDFRDSYGSPTARYGIDNYDSYQPPRSRRPATGTYDRNTEYRRDSSSSRSSAKYMDFDDDDDLDEGWKAAKSKWDKY